jgi:DNA-binding transcriptional MocR family regulator
LTTQASAAAAWLSDNFGARSSRGIASRMTELIEEGTLAAGTRLPTIRDVAARLGVSVGTVAVAWTSLKDDQLVSTSRRGGTVVLGASSARWADRRLSVPWYAVDLAQGSPDPALQPKLDKALLAGLQNARLHDPHKEFISGNLQRAAAVDWPFLPQAWSASGGGTEGAVLAFQAATTPGGYVAVEEPTSPRILDGLKSLGVIPVGVPCDEEGPTVAGLRAALDKSVTAFIFQPRAQVPLGHRVSDERIAELSEALRKSAPHVWVVEDDNTGPIAQHPAPSMGSLLPDRVLHVRAYCKAFGIDLRTSIIAGCATLVERTQQLRSYGQAMTSRILQDAVAYLIGDAETKRCLEFARRCYAQRRNALATALRERNLAVADGDGLILWLPVPDENAALTNLASYGVSVGAGSRCFISPPEGQGFLRIATSRLPDELSRISHLADLLARGVSGGYREEFD